MLAELRLVETAARVGQCERESGVLEDLELLVDV